ncbi:MAG: hypothetical protein A2W35_01255 [Chloroflexi bacterium RBG_16_57_11]|nr:MAG: hypothetical protein A2W35_01255 [Chloroflexi bacterium RBG_16_57_11]
MALEGKGFYLWQIRRTESGNATAIANVAVQAGLTHTLIKIADGDNAYNLDPITGADLVPPVLTALRDRNIEVWGWHYVYGYDPDAEADIAIQRIQELGVAGYIIDAEMQYEEPGRDAAARQFMSRLRLALPNFPIALSSFRYPTYHPSFPWQAFLERVDINMPQVYWVEAHNPGAQLIRSLREFEAITPFRPIVPTGSAYVQGDWQPTPAEMVEFMDTARNLNMAAANFWEWAHTRQYLPQLWEAIAAYDWPVDPSSQDIVPRYIAALNAHSAAQVALLYASNGVHVTPQSTLQGTSAIHEWYAELFSQILPNATFTLVEESGTLGSRHFTWISSSTAGTVSDGQDTFGLVDGKIVYHYTQFTVVP